MAGDILQCLVERSLACQGATFPFQYALSARAGGGCLGHYALEALCDLDTGATITSIDGISAFDLVHEGHCLRCCHGSQSKTKNDLSW